MPSRSAVLAHPHAIDRKTPLFLPPLRVLTIHFVAPSLPKFLIEGTLAAALAGAKFIKDNHLRTLVVLEMTNDFLGGEGKVFFLASTISKNHNGIVHAEGDPIAHLVKCSLPLHVPVESRAANLAYHQIVHNIIKKFSDVAAVW